MAKQRTKKAPKPAATASSAVAEPLVIGEVSLPSSASSDKKAGDFVMKRGQLMVGRGELRGPGDIVRRDELTPEEAEKFLARGTIAPQ